MSPSRKNKRRGAAAPAPLNDLLGLYMRDVASHQLLTSAEEIELGREIEAADVEAWIRILGYPSAIPFVLTSLERQLGGDAAVSTDALRAAVETARVTRSKEDRKRLRAEAAKLARQLQAIDRDRRHRNAVVKSLRSAAASARRRRGDKRIALPAPSRRLSRYLDAVEDAVRAAERPRRRFVESNLKLVFSIARHYDAGSLSFTDLIQEGNLGLMTAVDRFDHRRGYRFSTYATWWIRNAIGRAIANKSRTVRLPAHLAEKRRQLAKTRKALSAKLGRTATNEEVAARSGTTTEKLERMETHFAQQELSLDAPPNDNFERSRGESFRDPGTDEPTPFDALSDRMTRHRLDELLSQLRPTEASIIRQRYGLDGRAERTLQEIADQQGLSRERIRQIQTSALCKLRDAWRAQEEMDLADTPANADNRARDSRPHVATRSRRGRGGQR